MYGNSVNTKNEVSKSIMNDKICTIVSSFFILQLISSQLWDTVTMMIITKTETCGLQQMISLHAAPKHMISSC